MVKLPANVLGVPSKKYVLIALLLNAVDWTVESGNVRLPFMPNCHNGPPSPTADILTPFVPYNSTMLPP